MNNIASIADYIKSGYNKENRFGLELEHFIYDDNYNMITIDELSQVLEKIAKRLDLDHIKIEREGSFISAIIAPQYSLSVEPACQLEISIMASDDIAEIAHIYDGFRKVADEILKEVGYVLYHHGIFPTIESGDGKVEEIPLINKGRYITMDKHFESTGTLGKYMMRASAATQVSIDFSSEADAMKKLRVLQKIAPIVALLTEHRSSKKKDPMWKEYLVRNQIWQDIDASRCGYVEGSLDPEYKITDWASYIYHNQGLLTYKDGELIDITGQRVDEYYKNQEIESVEYLLSMYFPTVRLKTYIEYRVADSMDINKCVSYMHFIGSLMYEEGILDALDSMFAHVSEVGEIKAAEKEIFIKGYDASIYGKNILQWMEEIIELIYKYDPKALENITSLLPSPLLNKIYVGTIKGNDLQLIRDNQTIKDYLMESTAKYKDRVVRTLQVPKIFSSADAQIMFQVIEELYGVFDKVIEEYMVNPEYRKLFGFDEKLEDLILTPKKYKCNIPMSRIDLFLNEKTKAFKFCEFNTDGASAMNEDKELNKAFALTKAYEDFYTKYNGTTYELFYSWVDEALEVYGDYASNLDKLPNVCIIDFLENATINEFYIFKEAFEERGCKVSICDIRELELRDGVCYAKDGMKIDLIYRRAVTSDIMKHYDEVEIFLEAFRENAFCLVGDFRTQIAHNKVLYMILHKEQTKRLLNKKQISFVNNHIPYTVILDEIKDRADIMKEVLNYKDKWIIKPEDSYGSKGVYAGVEIKSLKQWETIIHSHMGQKYILQEFHTPYRTDNIKVEDGKCHWLDTSNLTGIFTYNGKAKGLYSRMSFEQMISTQYNEMTSPTMVIK